MYWSVNYWYNSSVIDGAKSFELVGCQSFILILGKSLLAFWLPRCEFVHDLEKIAQV